jgi:hypothetical protein
MVGQGQPHVGQKAPGQHIHFFLGGELHRVAQRFFGLAHIVACDHLHRTAQQSALGIDLFHRQLPALFVRLGELGNG